MSALSPSSYLDFSFSDMQQQQSSSSSMAEDGNAAMEDSNAMDLFRYYLDLQQQQQQQPQPSSSSQLSLTTTINLAEIEQSQTSYNSSNSNSNNSLFPFADASPSAPSATSLPPSAFAAALPAGSELPLQFDPSMWTSFMSHATGQMQQQPKVEETEPVFTTAQLPQMPVPEAKVTATIPSNTSSKKRARSNQPIAEEMDEHDDDAQEDDDESDEDDEQNDASFGSTTARATRSGRNTRGTAPVSTKSKRAVSVASSSATSAALPARPAKKAATSATHQGQSHPHALVPVPEWDDKLSKAEYDKLSSKEKRQMRNKISARNFRHRRKAHIDTLEAEIQDKNVVISVLQDEVGALRTENTDLRADIEMLKKNWESIAAKISMSTAAPAPVASTSIPAQHTASIASTTQPALSPDEDDLYGSASLPALSPPSSSASTNGDDHTELSFAGPGEKALARPSTSTSASTSSSTRRTTRSSANTKPPKPNLRKDLSSATGNGFWDSTSPFSSAFRGFGGAGMDVHTTLIPDFNVAGGLSPASALSEKRENGLDHFDTTTFQQRAHQQQQQQQQAGTPRNMNPALNALSQEQINALREQFGSSAAFGANSNAANNNNRSVDSRDRARILAGKDNIPGGVQDKSDQSFFEANPFLLLRGDSFQEYRGQLYAKLANNAAGIAASSAAFKNGATSPPEGLKPSFFASSPLLSEEKQVTESEMIAAGVAAIAQKTLFEKLSTAFWDAFSGQSSASASASATPLLKSAAAKDVDGKKVADVLSGKSRLAVVPNVESVKEEETGLEGAFEKLALRK